MQNKIQYYLSQTGIDRLINGAFKQVTIDQPSDPIVFIAEYLPFTEGDAVTITKNKVAGVNYQQIKTNLQAIAEDQEQEDDEDDSFNEKTLNPGAAYQMEPHKYQTSVFYNSPNQTRTNTSLNGQHPTEDDSKLYMMIKNNSILTLSDIIEQFKDDFQQNLEQLYELASQNQTLALVDDQSKSYGESTPTAKMLEEYLKIRSKKYQNVIEINQLAKGGEAIVFRLEHHEIDEVVIKTNLDLSNNSQKAFIDFMRETLYLKILQNKDYIAEVREEIIQYDQHNRKSLEDTR
ncbi:UNKNOWN [Stylonychia lemnae]|uniref:Uncharacterized protein n=1 Tax=Stylonychia lemnae TaxID=5949 RepID=A0A078AI37_STYLE|nr:UNKNOWN [Stylonychia lemnae]|eukprot:CDW80463.1 UNKNOWN [Stylonychia lemnae]